MKTKTSLQSGLSYYTIQTGDTLTKIAKAFYGPNVDASNVIGIYNINQSTIGSNPCHLPAGQVLAIPGGAVPVPQPQPYPPPPPPPPPDPVNPPLPGACQEFWGNGECLYKTCPYPPFTMPC
ncbi:MAG: LysM peptidoglycan-binding domain-containing protein [Chloroflexota bacterium]|jgi:hypothetical protein